MRDRIAGRVVRIAFPGDIAGPIMPLLRSEQAELEAIFGAPVDYVDEAPTEGPRWLVDLQPDAPHNCLHWDDATCTLTSVVRDENGFMATLQMIHSLVTLQTDEMTDIEETDLPTAAKRLRQEITRGFPGMEIRILTVADIEPMAGETLRMQDLECMVARLQDAHTAVRRVEPVYNPPYAVSLSATGATFLRIPPDSQAYAAGVRAGWSLEIDDPQGWRDRTGAPPHVHNLVAGRRAIALNGVAQRAFIAHSPLGEEVSWVENARPFNAAEIMQTRVVGDIVYIRLQSWITGLGIEERFAEIITGYRSGQKLVLDLRGNTGGNLLMAKDLRRRFLREPTLLGTIQFTRGDGTLAEAVEIWDEPPTNAWPGELIALTDGLTYSASEDFLHGLQGLPHVTVVGQPSGGGSGRPRTLPLIPGWIVTMSTALTFDRTGHCIEGKGVPVDIETNPFVDDWQDMLGGRAAGLL